MMQSLLLAPFSLGPYTLKNRMVMAPLTRCRAEQPGNLPTQINARYYAQRAGAGLIIAEATQVSPQGQGYAWTPGIHSAAQVARWEIVTKAVHQANGLIFLQLWHVGRISHPALQPDGQLPVAPSAIRPQGTAFIVNARGEGESVPFVTPRALATEEIPGVVQQFVQAAQNAKDAGFDGIEIHAANGYLLDQFLNSSTNRRSDAYGGSVENRSRLLCEVVEGVSGVWSSQQVGVRLSPLGTFNDMGDDNPEELFRYLSARLNSYPLAYLHVVDPIVSGNTTQADRDPQAERIMAIIRDEFRGTLIVCGGYDFDRAGTVLAGGRADLVAFGRLFLANPDLPERFLEGAGLNTPDETSFYGGGIAGYLDYPTLKQLRGEEPLKDYSLFDGAA